MNWINGLLWVRFAFAGLSRRNLTEALICPAWAQSTFRGWSFLVIVASLLLYEANRLANNALSLQALLLFQSLKQPFRPCPESS
jgi:hypothetical protein